MSTLTARLRSASPGLQIAALVAGAVVLIAQAIFLVWLVGSPQRAKTAQVQAKVATAMGDAAAQAGADAVAITSKGAQRDAGSDTLTRKHTDEIRKLPGADAPLDPALNRGGLVRLCERAAYRGSEPCLLLADPVQPPRPGGRGRAAQPDRDGR